MTEGMVIFLGGQALLVLAGVLGSHIQTRTQIAEIRGMLTQLQITISQLKSDHSEMNAKVDGISRHVAIIEGIEQGRAAADAARASRQAERRNHEVTK